MIAQQYLMLDYDCPAALLQRATAITPGLESPTVAPLADPQWVAVRAMVRRTEVEPGDGCVVRARGQGDPGLRHTVLPAVTGIPRQRKSATFDGQNRQPAAAAAVTVAVPAVSDATPAGSYSGAPGYGGAVPPNSGQNA